jgi:hypothetical protein
MQGGLISSVQLVMQKLCGRAGFECGGYEMSKLLTLTADAVELLCYSQGIWSELQENGRKWDEVEIGNNVENSLKITNRIYNSQMEFSFDCR